MVKSEISFGKDSAGALQIFEIPTRAELLSYLRVRLLGLRRNPNACPYVSLDMPAMYVYALIHELDLEEEETEQ